MFCYFVLNVAKSKSNLITVCFASVSTYFKTPALDLL